MVAIGLATVVGLLTAVLAGCSDSVDTSAISVTNSNTGEVSDELVPQDDAYEVYAEHIRVLNDCNWVRLMAQYPDNAEIHLCGLNFVEESRLEVGGTENVQWVADADFLAEPYRGSDA